MTRGRKGYRTLTRDEPACRVCNCTEHNACDEGCSWVEVENESPPLCSACSGRAGDLAEAVSRILDTIEGAGFLRSKIDRADEIGINALIRRKTFIREQKHNLDPAWGNR
jgi:hypothetical protein